METDKTLHFSQFEPCNSDRFIVYLSNVPSYLITSVNFSKNEIEFGVYSLLELHTPSWYVSLMGAEFENTKICYLNPLGNVIDTVVIDKLKVVDVRISQSWANDNPLTIKILCKIM